MAQAQEPPDITLQCQYLTGAIDPLAPIVGGAVTDVVGTPVVAAEQSRNDSALTRATGLATAMFRASTLTEVVDGGSFVAEVDARLSATDGDPGLVCADSIQVRGVGSLDVNVESDDGVVEATWLIRNTSKLDGARRENALAICPSGLADDFDTCSVHRVKAALRITAQGERNNGNLKYDRSTLTQKDIFRAYVGNNPRRRQHLLLVCGCLRQEVEAVAE